MDGHDVGWVGRMLDGLAGCWMDAQDVGWMDIMSCWVLIKLLFLLLFLPLVPIVKEGISGIV